jgi:hypothetical protein
MKTFWVAGDHLQLIEVNRGADADCKHRDIRIVNPKRGSYGFRRIVGLTIGQHDADTRMTFADRSSPVCRRKSVSDQFIEC